MIYRYAVLGALLALAVAGCSHTDTEEAGGTNGGTTTVVNNSTPAPKTTVVVPELKNSTQTTTTVNNNTTQTSNTESGSTSGTAGKMAASTSGTAGKTTAGKMSAETTTAGTAGSTDTTTGPATSSTNSSTSGGTSSTTTAAESKTIPGKMGQGQGSYPGWPCSAPSQKTSTGLQYKDCKVGTGAQPKDGDTVTVNYTGYLTDGTKFDSSLDHGQPFSFHIGQREVIPGWDEGVATMKIGGKRKLIVPPDLGYGANGQPPTIPPNATLVFDVELLKTES